MQAVVLGLVGLFGGLALILLYLGGGAGGDGATALAGILLVPASLCLVVYVVALMATKPLPRTWSAEHFVEIPTGGTSSDDFAQFASEWRKITRGPDSKTIRQIIGVAPSPGALQARILCIGAIEVPEIGDFRFEPVIISPTQYFWKGIGVVVAALAVSAAWLVRYLKLIPLPYSTSPFPSPGAWLLAGLGLLFGLRWFWRTTIRATYIRLAPGIIQVMQYPLFRKKPAIRGYPASSGTTAVLVAQPAALYLFRDDQADVIQLEHLRDLPAVVQSIFQALLSTAPTPPLSDEDLVG